MLSTKNQLIYGMTAGVLLVLAIFLLKEALVMAWAINKAIAIGLGAVLLIGTQVIVTTNTSTNR